MKSFEYIKRLTGAAVLLFLFFSNLCTANNSGISVGPYVRFTGAYTAQVLWDSYQKTDSIVEYGQSKKLGRTFHQNSVTKKHKVQLSELAWRRKYYYRVGFTNDAGKKIFSDIYTFDNSINYTRYDCSKVNTPYAKDCKENIYSDAADKIVKMSGTEKGWCLVYGCKIGRLAFEIARRTDMMVTGIDNDKSAIDRGRKLLLDVGVYGSRVSLFHTKSLIKTRLPSHFFNLIVSDRILVDSVADGSAEEVCRVLRPCGSKAIFLTAENVKNSQLDRWIKKATLKAQRYNSGQFEGYVIEKPEISSGGAWPRQYGGVDNCSYSGGDLFGASRTNELKVQWIGRPGADFGADRNPRMPAPVMENGRLYHQGLDRIAAMDSYNGVIYWSLEIPNLMRVNTPRDSGYVCADKKGIYVAVDNDCWTLNGDTGKRLRTFSIDQPGMEWGYVGVYNGMLYGSAQFRGAHYRDFWGKQSWYDAASGEQTYKVCGRYMFAVDIDSGHVIWNDKMSQRGVIINSTITIGGERVYFVESRNRVVRNLKTGRIKAGQLWLDQYIVALDSATGKKLWEKPIDTADGIVVFFMQYYDEKLFISSSGSKYNLYVFDAGQGKQLWQKSHEWTGKDHSGHMQHPVIFEGKVYYEPYVYDIDSSEVICKDMGRHEGCATYAAAEGVLIYRGKDRRISMWDTVEKKVTSWEGLRPSCWLSTIPAGSMVLSPEGGGGCSCNGWINTSVGFIAKTESSRK